MKKTLIISFVALSLVFTGCNNEAENDINNADQMTQPIQYRMDDQNDNVEFTEDKKPNTPLTTADKMAERNNNPNAYPNSNREQDQLARTIRDHIRKIPGVHDVQAMVTDNQVNVALDTEDEFRGNPNLLNKVRDSIEHLVEGRKIQIYTDGAYFDRMRNLNTSPDRYED